MPWPFASLASQRSSQPSRLIAETSLWNLALGSASLTSLVLRRSQARPGWHRPNRDALAGSARSLLLAQSDSEAGVGADRSRPKRQRRGRSAFSRGVRCPPMTGRKRREASWRELPPAEMAAHLLATETIADRYWTTEPRLPREKRSDFVRRVLLSETPRVERDTPEAEPDTYEAEPDTHEAAEPAGGRRGYYLLNADGGNRGDRQGRAAIGALVRTRRLATVAQISKTIGPATHNVAEYRALIEGLKLAREQGIERIRVYMDSEIVVDQVNGVSAVRQARRLELHAEAKCLVGLFESFRIS